MKRISEEEYYKKMHNMRKLKTFKSIHKNWYECFNYILRSYKVSFTDRAINSLFYNFDMQNWTALHLDKTEYKNYSKEDLLEEFFGECSYISDRTSYDRLFRTHWLFRRAFDSELDRIRFPLTYRSLKIKKKIK